jgi:hypothetical protein
MSQETSDLILGAVGLVIFLVFVFAAGLLLSKYKNARFAKAWSPLVPLVNGTVTGDGGGAATSWLTGVYRGAQMRASMSPDRNTSSEGGGTKYNYFDVTLLDVPGARDWAVIYDTPILGFGKKGWRVKAEDAALEEDLLRSGVVEMVARFGVPHLPASFGLPAVEYRRRERTLRYSADVTPQWAPTPEHFRAQLELLLRLAEVNKEVNSA